MNRKIVLFISLSVLLVVAGLPLTLKQNWKQFSGTNKPHQSLLAGTVHNVKLFNEHGEVLLQQIIDDSIRIMFRFTPSTCSCLEPDFSEAVNLLTKSMGESKVFVVIAAENTKDVFHFRERTRLSCPIYGTTETVLPSNDTLQLPYACVVFPNMTAEHIVAVNLNNIKKLIPYAEEITR